MKQISSRRIINALGYSPAILIPKMVALLATLIFTRTVSPEQFGLYSLVLLYGELLDAVFLSWTRLSVMRFYFEGDLSNRNEVLKIGVYMQMAGILAGTLAGWGISWGIGISEYQEFFIMILLYFYTSGIIRYSLNLIRARNNKQHYIFVETFRSVIGLLMALLLTKLCGESYVSLIVGLCSCALLFAVLLAREDIKEVNDWRVPNIDRLKEMLRYSAPLLLVFFLSQVIVVTDRFFLTMYAGPSAVGIYAAVFSLGKPVLDVIFTTINMSTFPALIKEYEAVENCQADDNSKLDKVFEVAIVKMAFFAIPAIFFISANAQQIVAVMLPSSYENGSSLVLTLVAIAALLIGAKNFIYDQVFHLVKKSIHQSYTLIPAAIVGIVLNIYLIPIYGVVGAAWASVISSGIALFTSKVISQKYFRVNIPLVQIKKILCGSILLYCVAVYTSAGSSLSELLISSLLSGGAYIVVCWCLGVLGFIRKNIT